jgi:ABC-type sugar transport system permease subunit
MVKQAISIPGGVGEGRRRRRWGRRLIPVGYIAPSLLVLALVSLYPFVNGLYLSLTNSSLLGPGAFVGLDSFRTVLASPDFGGAVVFTVLFALCAVTGSYTVGLLLALLLNMPVWGRGFFRAALLIPWVIPPIVSIVSWRWMLDQSGLINSVLTALGLQPIYFLSSEFWARVSVIVVKIWVSFPFMLVTILAALQAISQDLYEAAALDGCGRWAAFRHITVPHLKMVTLISWILMTIYSVNDFPTIWLLTQGGPVNATEGLIVLAYKYAFQVSNVGLGAAVSVIAMLGMLALGLALLRLMPSHEEASL